MASRRSATARWVAAGLLPMLLVVVAGTGRGFAATSGWSIALSPTTVTAATATPIKATFTNLGGPDGTRELGCVRISLPLTFTISSASVVGKPPGSAWSASVGLGMVRISSPSGGDRLPPDGRTSVTAAITVLALTPGTYTWTANAYRQGDCTDGFSEPISLKVVVDLDILPVPTALPTILPTALPTILPTALPSVLPTLLPTARPTPTPAPTPPSATTPTPTPTATPRSAGTPLPGETPPGAGSTPNGSSGGSGASSGGSGGSRATPGSTANASPMPSPSADAGLAMPAGPTDPSSGGAPPITLTSGFETPMGGGFEWAVPGLVLSVPGLLIVLLAIGVQLVGAIAWLPIVRRRIGAFGFGRRVRRSSTRASAD
jgi:hypothetical protein